MNNVSNRPRIPRNVRWDDHWRILQDCDIWWQDRTHATPFPFSVFPSNRYPHGSWVGVISKLRPSLRNDWFRFERLHQTRLLGCAAKDSDDWALLGGMMGFTIKAVFGNDVTLARIQATVQEVMDANDAAFPEVATNAYRKLTSFAGIGPGVATRLLTLARPDRLVSLNSASRQGLANYAGLASGSLDQPRTYEELLRYIYRRPWFLLPKPTFGSLIEEEAWSMRAALLDSFIYTDKQP